MILDCVLTACNNNKVYIEFIPIFIKAWKKLYPNVDIKIILINNDIPEEYLIYKKYIILFPPIENISTAFTSQIIRLFYPCLLNYKNGIMITDMDILPMNSTYYTKNIESFDNNKFIYYRNVCLNQKEIAMCYNIAHSDTWKDIFNIYTEKDILDRIAYINSTINYDGNHGGSGWNTDQRYFYNNITMWSKYNSDFVYLFDNKTGYNRLDRHENFKITDKDNIINEMYTDYHALRPYSTYANINNEIIDLLPNYSKIIKILVIASRGLIYDRLIDIYWKPFIKYVNKNYKNIHVHLIFGNDSNVSDLQDIKDNLIIGDNPESLIPGILKKTIYAFKQIIDKDFHYIFRTNLSSFINIEKFIKWTATIKDKNVYKGFIGYLNGIKFASGAGYLLSRDIIQYIIDNEHLLNKDLPDDVAIGKLLMIKIGVENSTRFDIINNQNINDLNKIGNFDYHHIRIKNPTRENDIIAFLYLINKIYSF